MKPKRKRRIKRKLNVTYTHKDKSGMLWRFVGSRPVSELADQVTASCGLDLLQ